MHHLLDLISLLVFNITDNRKAKIIIFFEWELRLKWKAKLNNESSETISGTVEIPNLSDENGINDLDVRTQHLNSNPNLQFF